MRRTRYTFTMSHESSNDIVRKVVLCYQPDVMRRHYVECGWTVLSVERGDYRREARKQAMVPQGGGFKINQANLREAIDLLGIKLPVQIRYNGKAGPTNGTHRFAPRSGKFMHDQERDTARGGMVHRITLKSYLTADQAGRTLWHELTHAMQAERETREAQTMREAFMGWRFCSARGRGVSYSRKPIEVEAREHEPLNDDLPLAR